MDLMLLTDDPAEAAHAVIEAYNATNAAGTGKTAPKPGINAPVHARTAPVRKAATRKASARKKPERTAPAPRTRQGT